MTNAAMVHSRIESSVGWIVFDNAARLNAMSISMWEAIPEIITRYQSDDSVRVVVMKGAGRKAFVSGADISEFDKQRGDPEAIARYDAAGDRAFRSLATLTKPLLASVDGYCIGGGLALALACDMRIASDVSRFAIPAAKLGLGYGLDGVQRLVALVGPAVAQDMLFTARHFGADEALGVGLVNQVVPASEHADTVAQITSRCVENAPLTLTAAKLAVRACLALSSSEDRAVVEGAVRRCFASDDYLEGRRAFQEKRKPNFHGR